MGHAREVDDAELAAQLIDRMARDQDAREAARGLSDDISWDRVRAADVHNTAWLKQVLDERGWPRRADVGEEAAKAAWLLAQHADHDIGFQRRCLAMLSDAVSRGDADAGDLAYLTDGSAGPMGYLSFTAPSSRADHVGGWYPNRSRTSPTWMSGAAASDSRRSPSTKNR